MKKSRFTEEQIIYALRLADSGKTVIDVCQRIRDIAMSRPRFGYLRVLVMLKREGWQVGKKRVYRLYRQEGLQLRMKVKRRKRIALLRGFCLLSRFDCRPDHPESEHGNQGGRVCH